MPDALSYDPALQRLSVGSGNIELVSKVVGDYEVPAKQVLVQ